MRTNCHSAADNCVAAEQIEIQLEVLEVLHTFRRNGNGISVVLRHSGRKNCQL